MYFTPLIVTNVFFYAGPCDGHPACSQHSWPWSQKEDLAAGTGPCLITQCGGGLLHVQYSHVLVDLLYSHWQMEEMECDANIEWSVWFQLVIVLKKEVIKTNNVTEHEDTDKYRQLLVRTLHSCSVRFPDMAANVIPVVSFIWSSS